MGADFLLVIVPVPDTTPEAIAALHTRADSLEQRVFEDIAETCLGCEDEDGYPAARALLHRAIDEIFGSGWRRDVGKLVIGGVTYAATGGLSHGDTPTDAWDWLVALDASGLTWDQIQPTLSRTEISTAINGALASTGGDPLVLHGLRLATTALADLISKDESEPNRVSFLRDCGLGTDG